MGTKFHGAVSLPIAEYVDLAEFSFVSTSAFASLVCIPAGIASSTVGIKNFCNHCRNQKVSVSYQEKEENEA